MSGRPARIAFVCDFGIVHARKLIQQFARSPEQFEVTVYSSTSAPAMEGVRLVSTVPATRSSRGKLVGMAWEVVRRPLMHWQRAAAVIWSWSMLWEARGLRAYFDRTADLERPDVIHALRAQPEGLGAMGLARRFPDVPFLVSLWGQDLVLFAGSSRRMRKHTIKLMQRVTAVVPDNGRDERLAREEFGLRPGTPSLVMPAPGGLDVHELRSYVAPGEPLPALAGSPRILACRGYESAYHRLNLLMRAFRTLRSTHPAAHLYIEVPRKPKRRAALEREIRDLGLADSVTILQSSRADLQRAMQVCEILAFATEHDGLSMSLMEGMYHGQLPVVFDHECYRPYLVPGENAVVFREMTVAAVAAALDVAIRMAPGWRQGHGATWRARLEAMASQEVWFPRIVEVYRDQITGTAD